MGFVIFLSLMFLWRRRRFEGQIFLAFGVLYGIGRALLETIRDDAERGVVAGMSTSMFLGIVTAVLAAAIYVYRMKTQPLATSASLFDPVPVDAPAKAETKSETKVETKADET
jgi:prolipoprotein diacylglyceryltransferase